MAKSAFEIKMDYNRAIRQANELDSIARELRNTANNELQDCVADISHNWTGENSNAYVQKCNVLKSNIVSTAKKIEKTADTIRLIAKKIYDAEMFALRLALARR